MLPPLPRFFADAAWCHMAAFLQKIGGEGWGERWMQRVVTIDANPRLYDLPWVVLDAGLANTVWQWNPVTTVSQVLSEIADFADTQGDWIGQSM
jgi:hypothetical protein